LGDFEIAKQPVVEKVGERGTEQAHVEHAGPGGPRNGAPIFERPESDSALNGDGKNEKRAEDEIVSGHGEGVVTGGNAFAECGIEREAERAGKGDGVAEKRGRTVRDIGASGHQGDSTESDGHAEHFAQRGFFESEKNGENEGVDWAHANDDGGMADRRVAQADGEADLIDGDDEESEIGEGPEIARGDSPPFYRLEGGKAAAERGEADHENGSEHDAEGGQGERRKRTKSGFDGEEVERPNSHEENDGSDEDGARRRWTGGGVYAHGREPENIWWIVYGTRSSGAGERGRKRLPQR